MEDKENENQEMGENGDTEQRKTGACHHRQRLPGSAGADTDSVCSHGCWEPLCHTFQDTEATKT